MKMDDVAPPAAEARTLNVSLTPWCASHPLVCVSHPGVCLMLLALWCDMYDIHVVCKLHIYTNDCTFLFM